MSKKSRKTHHLARSRPQRVPTAKILIVVEGHSEEKYFNTLRNRHKLHTVDVKNPDCTDPINLWNEAKTFFEESVSNSQNSINVLPYDIVCIVYDLEKPHDEKRKLSKQAQEQADNFVEKYKRKKGKNHKIKHEIKIVFTLSDPSFEFWYVLHYEKTTKSFTGSDEVEGYLKRYWKEYQKNSEPTQEILDKTEIAVKNAKWVRNQNETNKS
ncbi:MAG: RloB family protein, partial [Planctomycetaceae bacterium]|nr:RloB family protein [Planctomycetaceae bacterium]